jgi:CheY-like chemotaxis protein
MSFLDGTERRKERTFPYIMPSGCPQSPAENIRFPPNLLFVKLSGNRHRPCVKLFMAPDKRKPNTKKLQGKRILIVEDHPSVSEILTNLLRSYCHPSNANSGRDALERIELKAPDVILLDLSLPDMNGLEIARLVRQNEKTSHIPILAMSGSRSPTDKRECLEMGCNDFIDKPFSVSTLLLRLSALIPVRSYPLTQDNSQLARPLGK